MQFCNDTAQDLNDGLRYLGSPLYKVSRVQEDLDTIRLSTLKVAQEERSVINSISPILIFPRPSFEDLSPRLWRVLEEASKSVIIHVSLLFLNSPFPEPTTHSLRTTTRGTSHWWRTVMRKWWLPKTQKEVQNGPKMGAEAEGLRNRWEEKIVRCSEKSPTYDFTQCQCQSGTGHYQTGHYQNTAMCFTCTQNVSERAVSNSFETSVIQSYIISLNGAGVIRASKVNCNLCMYSLISGTPSLVKRCNHITLTWQRIYTSHS